MDRYPRARIVALIASSLAVGFAAAALVGGGPRRVPDAVAWVALAGGAVTMWLCLRQYRRPTTYTTALTRFNEGVVSGALVAAGLLNADGDSPSLVTPVLRYAEGFQVVVDLPDGVTASDAIAARPQLAMALRVDLSALTVEHLPSGPSRADRVRIGTSTD